MAKIDSFLKLVTEQQASDLHFCSGSVPTIRYGGDLIQLPFRELGELETIRFLMEIIDDKSREKLEKEKELDFVYKIDGVGRFRANYHWHIDGIGAVFRIIPNEIPTIDKMGLPKIFRQIIQISNGLILVTGPTGAGKTTTLAGLVNEVNITQRRHVITIEDPIEFLHKPIKSLITHRQVGMHAETFNSALRSALRESPDVLVIGEMRDPESVELALRAAETGCLVLGTLHTDSAGKAINRIIDALPDRSQDQVRATLSVLLRAVISQRLVKRASGEGRIAAVEVTLCEETTT